MPVAPPGAIGHEAPSDQSLAPSHGPRTGTCCPRGFEGRSDSARANPQDSRPDARRGLGPATAASAQQHAGVRAGISGGPTQFYFGGDFETPPVIEHLTFRPNLEVGVGDHETLDPLNLEFAYHVPLARQPWTLYLGAGPAVNWATYRTGNPPFGNFDERRGRVQPARRRRAPQRPVRRAEGRDDRPPERQVRRRDPLPLDASPAGGAASRGAAPVAPRPAGKCYSRTKPPGVSRRTTGED